MTRPRVAFITYDFMRENGILFPAGCAYYRCALPRAATGVPSRFGLPAWIARLGFGVRVSDVEAEFGFDTVVLKLMMDRWLPEQIRVAQELGQRVIVDVDDFYDGIDKSNHANRTTDPSYNPSSNREHYRDIVLAADVVTVTTPFLQQYYQDLGASDVRVIRNGINAQQFQKRKHRSFKPVLGWAGAIRWRSNDVETAAPWLGDFLEDHGLMFHHAGHMDDTTPFAKAARVPWRHMMISGMQPMYAYQTMLDFDIGLVLLSDIPFNHAKSAIKGLEYAASNIPFVAQATPEYVRLAEQGVGRVASTPDEWVAHLTDLLNYRTRKVEAAHARSRVLAEHTVDARAGEWNALFDEQTSRVDIPTVVVPYKAL